MSFDALTAANMMGYSLRKSLTKRKGQDNLRPDSNVDTDSGCESTSSSSHDRRGLNPNGDPAVPRKAKRSSQKTQSPEQEASETTAADTLSNTPPVPRALNIDPARRNVTLPRQLLDRYKTRSAAQNGPSIITASSSISRPSRQTAFNELFGEDSVSPTTVKTEPPSRARSAENVRLVTGEEYEIVTSGRTSGTSMRSNSADVVRSALRDLQVESEEPQRRTSRSNSKREERNDSATGPLQQDKKSSMDLGKPGVQSDASARPPTLTFRKKSGEPNQTNSWKKSSTSNSSSSKEGCGKAASQSLSDGLSTSATPANSPTFPTASRPLISLCKNSSHEVKESLSPDSLASTPLPHHTQQLPKSPSPAQKAPPPLFASSVLVSPPRYDPTKRTDLQWADSRCGTSRPEMPWGYLKKWTCCRCSATTMVEQRECARLTCGHARCGTSCRLPADGKTDHTIVG